MRDKVRPKRLVTTQWEHTDVVTVADSLADTNGALLSWCLVDLDKIVGHVDSVMTA
jgi:hypothetical protein